MTQAQFKSPFSTIQIVIFTLLGFLVFQIAEYRCFPMGEVKDQCLTNDFTENFLLDTNFQTLLSGLLMIRFPEIIPLRAWKSSIFSSFNCRLRFKEQQTKMLLKDPKNHELSHSDLESKQPWKRVFDCNQVSPRIVPKGNSHATAEFKHGQRIYFIPAP